ncbi:SEC-C metal-binding domain-containing protein [Paenibacillus protaetiae]|uniref:Uncharacterized protein n=1 Tax=Paenibacillus protaetiae TaxID=2509456 RepID=A0A4V0YFK5_9BACL|nr:SEC-C metal-binding domain-containing protein [Paenibacillus protaetiae]QAY68031.1 hypothetical protein ET464_18315 [Paenibacillus protaetiae]
MATIGRNEPCHCGSGLKYKRCCLEKDQTNARLQSALLSSGHRSVALTEQDIIHMVEQELEWQADSYRQLALHLHENMNGRYEESIIVEAIALWNRFSAETKPSFRKPGIHCAAIELAVSEANGIAKSQAELAEHYGVSTTSLSKRFQEINDFIENKLSAAPKAASNNDAAASAELPAFDMNDELEKMGKAMGGILV